MVCLDVIALRDGASRSPLLLATCPPHSRTGLTARCSFPGALRFVPGSVMFPTVGPMRGLAMLSSTFPFG
jgi:hypothetical protein